MPSLPWRLMDNLTIAAASGIRSRMQSLDLLANNLANAGTSGFKQDQEFYSLFTSADAGSAAGEPVATMPVIQRQWTDFSQGTIQPTGNPLDVALNCPGFFVVDGPNGPLYTRNGSLQVLASGELAASDGYPIRSAAGTPIKVAGGQPIEISTDGTVSQDHQAIGKIAVVQFISPGSLQKASGASFQNADAQNQPAPAAQVDIQQGKLEGSNVPVAGAAMRLVGIMRQFEMLQKAVGLSSEMDTKSIQEVARVGP